MLEEHEAFCATLEQAGVEVVVGEPLEGNPDAIFVHDPATVTDGRAILLRPGKAARRDEVESIAADFARAGIDVVARLQGDELAEGGDLLWLDEGTLVVGRGYRTNDAGIDALRRALPDVAVIAVDLPHYHGRREVMHMLSLISPLDDNLAVVYPPLMPVRLVELLEQREVQLVEVPDTEFQSMACNVLALAPRVALALGGNLVTRARLEAAGVDVFVYAGEELSRKGDGGPTCLTRPLERS
jgi:N-dimethylarginine dimethylaminohydrolase